MANEADKSSGRGIGSVRVGYAAGITLVLEQSAYICHGKVNPETMVCLCRILQLGFMSMPGCLCPPGLFRGSEFGAEFSSLRKGAMTRVSHVDDYKQQLSSAMIRFTEESPAQIAFASHLLACCDDIIIEDSTTTSTLRL